MADIKRILKKKTWTGRELGIIEVTDAAERYKQRKDGKEEVRLVEENTFLAMLDSLKGKPNDINIFKGYISLHEWLSVKINIAETRFQSAQLGYNVLLNEFIQAHIAENVITYKGKLPYIVTQKQYDDMKSAALEKYCADEDGEMYYNVFELIDRSITYFLKRLREEPKKANPLKAIRKKYINEPVKSRFILDRWNKIEGEGYYTLQDGRRSDQMSPEEWRAALTTPKWKEITESEDKTALNAIVQRRVIERAKVIFHGGTDEEADRLQTQTDIEQGLNVPCEWHYYEDPPSDLTKWDFIENDKIYEYYPYAINGGDAYDEENYIASLKDFYNEFEELVKVILADIDKNFYKNHGDKKPLSDLTVEEWTLHCFKKRDLYMSGFYGIEEEAVGDIAVFNDLRALVNGVAILRPSDEACNMGKSGRTIDENGYFIEPSTEDVIDEISLNAYFPEAEHYAESIENIEETKKMLLDSLYFLKNYNYVIDRISEIYEIPNADAFKCEHLEALCTKIDALNASFLMLYEQIKNNAYSDKEIQAKKLKVLQDLFGEIDYKSLQLPKENRDKIEELLLNFQAFKGEHAEEFYFLLYQRPDNQGEGANI